MTCSLCTKASVNKCKYKYDWVIFFLNYLNNAIKVFRSLEKSGHPLECYCSTGLSVFHSFIKILSSQRKKMLILIYIH